MKKLTFILSILLLFSCSKDPVIKVSPLVGAFEGKVDFGDGVTVDTYFERTEQGEVFWDIFQKDNTGNYVERYNWPSISMFDVSNNPANWLYGKIETSETRFLVYSPAAPESGFYTSMQFGLTDFPIGWNAHYSVVDFDETFTTYTIKNVCVPQEFQLANDSLCEGWENWESNPLTFTGTRVK